MIDSSTNRPRTTNCPPEPPATVFVHVALAVPLRRLFEYSVLENAVEVKPGMRVVVPFSRSEKIGIIVKVSDQPQFTLNKIKPINKVLDDTPLVNQNIIDLFEWMKNYYHAPPGEVWQTLLPTALIKGKLCQLKRTSLWKIRHEGIAALENNEVANNAVKQQQALRILSDNLATGIPHDNLSNLGLGLSTLKAISGKKWAERIFSSNEPSAQGLPTNLSINKPTNLRLNSEQASAVDSVCGTLNNFKTWLLFGVTASGKTEVYLQIIDQVLKQGRQALVLVPEIGLTPQTVERFQRRFNTPIETIHSAMTEQQRLQSWIKARSGEAKIVIGTRSALFVPLKNPGIIIIDEEHDSSFKQQQGLRYSARDVAMVRGNIEKIPVLLGSASPSIESLMNVKKGKITELTLSQKAMTSHAIKYRVIDLKNQPMQQGLSFALIDSINQHLEQKGQILLFLNRRGYSPVLLCHNCGWSSQCKRCDTHFTFHSSNHHLQCHHCGSSRRAPQQCPDCRGGEMVPVGLGTERLEESIKNLFPNARVKRIDRDTTRRKSAMKNFVNEIKSGEVDILIGTQMLAKGHHFPAVSLVGLIDMDGALYSSDFRAPEYAAQLITQVSGRAGRADKKGEVVIQTHLAEHPMLKQLISSGYKTFTELAIQERISAQLPPHTYNALFQAESTYLGHTKTFLQEVKQILMSNNHSKVNLLGPVPAFYTKKAGKFRYQLYVESNNRKDLHRLLHMNLSEIEKLKSVSRVKWRMEVDPISD